MGYTDIKGSIERPGRGGEGDAVTSYYTAIVALVWMAIGVLCVLIRENHRISHDDKRLLYLTYVLIAVSALAEWCGVLLNGRQDVPRWMLKAAKCADYMLTPMAGGALVAQMRLHNRWLTVMKAILGANVLFQLVGIFFGWTVSVDAQGFYSHGPLYIVYMGACFATIVLVVIEFILYGQGFRRQNRVSLYTVMLFVVVGIVLQELLPSEPRTAYIAMTIGAALMFIHYSEFASMAADDHLSAQQQQIDTDALTGVSSRHAYSQRLNELDAGGPLPEDLVAFTIDIKGLKQVNDTLGHEAGDELIIGAARCIEGTMGNSAKCYRTGGDEFVVLTRMPADAAEMALSHLKRETARWQGRTVKSLSLAAGYALAGDNPGLSAEKLVKQADMAMYAAKAAYYRENGMDRRRR